VKMATVPTITFEDLTGTAEAANLEVWKQYEPAPHEVIFGMVAVVSSTTNAADCDTVEGGSCQYWFRRAAPPINDPDDTTWARPLLAHLGTTLYGFVGPILADGTCGPFGAPSGGPDSETDADFCSKCCATNALGGSSDVSGGREPLHDMPIPNQANRVGKRFLTDQTGLSTPNNVRVFAVNFAGAGCVDCGGTILDIDCRNNDPTPKDPQQCEAWLIRGWGDKLDADAFASAPNAQVPVDAWTLSQDYTILSAQGLANLYDRGREKEMCDPARAGGPPCPTSWDDATCCNTGLKCGRRAAAWCVLTEFGPDGAEHDRDAQVGDGISSVFNMHAPNSLVPIHYITIEWAGTKEGNTIGLAFDNFNTARGLSATTAAPSAAPTSGGVIGDPHFFGFSGGSFDVMGDPGHIYNIISDYDFQLNGRFVAGRTAHNTTYFGEAGLSTAEHTLFFDPETCSALVDDEIALPRSYGRYYLEEGIVVHLGGKVIEVVSPRFGITFDCISKAGSNHFNMRARYLRLDLGGDDIPHGILGQTADGRVRYKSGSQGEGAIEGVYTDYEVSNMFATDFRFNKFGTAQVSHRKLLAVAESGKYMWAAQRY